jgi:hypothetical protein
VGEIEALIRDWNICRLKSRLELVADLRVIVDHLLGKFLDVFSLGVFQSQLARIDLKVLATEACL